MEVFPIGSVDITNDIAIYKDGGAKLESLNSLDFFDTIEELEKFIAINNLKK